MQPHRDTERERERDRCTHTQCESLTAEIGFHIDGFQVHMLVVTNGVRTKLLDAEAQD
jgi:hypothetical protein